MLEKCRENVVKRIGELFMLEECWTNVGQMLLVCTGQNKFSNIFSTFFQHLVTSCDQFEVMWLNGQNGSNALTPIFRRLSLLILNGMKNKTRAPPPICLFLLSNVAPLHKIILTQNIWWSLYKQICYYWCNIFLFFYFG